VKEETRHHDRRTTRISLPSVTSIRAREVRGKFDIPASAMAAEVFTAHSVPTPSFYGITQPDFGKRIVQFIASQRIHQSLLYCAEWDLKTVGHRALPPPPLFIRYLQRSAQSPARQSAHLLPTILISVLGPKKFRARRSVTPQLQLAHVDEVRADPKKVPARVGIPFVDIAGPAYSTHS